MNHFSADTSNRLDSFLSERTGKSRSLIQEHIKNGRVTVNKKTVTKPSHRIGLGDSISIEIVEEHNPSHLIPTPGSLEILYEDEYMLAINKAAGVVVHPGAGRKENTLVHHLLHYLGSSSFSNSSNDRPGIVHRLDQGTTGVLLVAKNDSTQVLLSELFKERQIKKQYQAITWGKMNLSGTIDSPIGRDRKDRKKISSQTQKARSAVTHWNSLERFQHFTYVSLLPLTGRTHQLRVHLSEKGYPIVGDPTYGRGKPKTSLISTPLREWIVNLNHTLLHAFSLEFNHPYTEEPLLISAPLPHDFQQCLTLLKELDPCQN